MAQNYRQPGNIVTLPVTASQVEGHVITVGELAGVVVAKETRTATTASVGLSGVYEVNKDNSNIGVGAVVYADEGDNRVSTTNAGDRKMLGFALKAANASASTVEVLLMPGARA